MRFSSFVPGQTDHDGILSGLDSCGDDAVGHVIGACDTPKDVEQDDLHARIARDDPECVDDLLGVRRSADSRKLAGSPAVVLHQDPSSPSLRPGTVHDACPRSPRADEGEVRLARANLARLLGGLVAEGPRARDGARARCRRSHLRVEGDDVAAGRVTTSGLISASEQPFFMNADRAPS